MNENIGNLLDVSGGIVVHGCNAQGVMGSGVAKEIRARCPHAYEAYFRHFQQHGLKVGQVVWAAPVEGCPFWIANGITQKFYGRNASVTYVDYNAVRDVFEQVRQKATTLNLPVHYPKIGAGLGGGDWGIISGIIAEKLDGIEHKLWVQPIAPTKPVSRSAPSKS